MSAGHTHPVIEHKGLQTVGGAELWLTVSDVGLKKGGGAANRALSFNKCATEPRLNESVKNLVIIHFISSLWGAFVVFLAKEKSINLCGFWLPFGMWSSLNPTGSGVGNNVSPEGHAVLDKMREGQRIWLLISANWNVFELTFAVRTQYAAVQFWRVFPLFPAIKSL